MILPAADDKPIYLLQTAEHIPDTIRITGGWDLEYQEKVKPFLKRDKVFVDVGANIGAWTLFLAKHTDKLVFAFEPQTMVFYQLGGNLWANNANNVKAYPLACGSREQHGTKVEFNPMIAHNNGAVEVKSVPAQGKGLETPNILALDSMGLDNVGFMKIDVEGHEEDVLRGATELIMKCRPYIFYECWTRDSFKAQRESLFNYIASLGYISIPMGADNFLACPRETVTIIDNNVRTCVNDILTEFKSVNPIVVTDKESLHKEIGMETKTLSDLNKTPKVDLIFFEKNTHLPALIAMLNRLTVNIIVFEDETDTYKPLLEDKRYRLHKSAGKYRAYVSPHPQWTWEESGPA